MIYLALLLQYLWMFFLWGGTAYLVFWQGHSPWWFLLTIFASGFSFVVRQ